MSGASRLTFQLREPAIWVRQSVDRRAKGMPSPRSRRDLLAAALAAPLLAVGLGGAADVRAETLAMTVYKSPTCGCCGAWVDHVRAAGFAVTVKDVDDLAPIKLMAGVPQPLQSCHTASIGGYVVEGHVPADVIERFLAERPQARGLAVPGMPVGSPGMEGPNPRPYQVLSFDSAGGTAVYRTVRP